MDESVGFTRSKHRKFTIMRFYETFLNYSASKVQQKVHQQHLAKNMVYLSPPLGISTTEAGGARMQYIPNLSSEKRWLYL